MDSNGFQSGREAVLFAVAFYLGSLIAEQRHEQEIARLREATRNAQNQTIHLMTMLRGGRESDESES